MKLLNRSVLQALMLAGVCLAAPATLHAQTTPIWSDEFDGERIDRSTWTFNTGGSGNGNGELQYYTASHKNAYLEDGKLVIEARREPMEGKEFTSARLHTNGRMGFRYGSIEARIKLPRLDNGLWPAFWMLGNNFGIDGWPKSGEWDIMEAGSKAAQDNGTVNQHVTGAVHWWHETGTWSDWLAASHSESYDLPTNVHDDYHTYRMDWTPSQVSMSVDGHTYMTMDITDPNLSELSANPAHVILNLAVGGWNYVEITDPNQITAPMPAKMLVDYVRLYENEYTELFLAEDNLASGTFGIMTDTTPVMSELNWGDNTNLYIWNNMTAIATEPSEGNAALAYQIQPGDWWGMGLLHKDYNMRNYVQGYLHVDIKTESTTSFTISLASTSGGDGSVTLTDGGEQYGLVRDGEWHSVAIPLSRFGNLDVETIKTFFSVSGPAPTSVMEIAFDNIYLTESIQLAAPEFGNFGVFTETAAHRDAGDFGFGVNGDLFLWDETLTLEAGEVLEGNASLNLKSTGKGWYGLGLTAREGFNLTAFDNPNGKFHFSMKTTNQNAFQIGLKSGGQNDIGQVWINFQLGNDPYSFVRDGQWHEVVIPVSQLALDLDLFDVRQVFQLLGVGEIENIAIDDIYFSGGLAAQDPGHGGPVVNRAPTAAIKPSVTGGAPALSVTFDGSQSADVNGDELTYSWDFGDGNTDSGVNVTHVYTAEGTYTVTLTVSDGELSNSSKTHIFVDENHGQTRSEKRGLGFGHHSVEDFDAISKGISWWYNWSHKPDVLIENVLSNYDVEFAPMAWNGGFDDQAMRAYIATNPEVKYILAFNEPNFIDQANMTPSQAAAEWHRLEAIADEFDLKIVSVAMNFCGHCVTENGTTYYDPIAYFDDFFAACPDCRVDAISIHAYMQDVGGVEWYVNLFKKYNRPIWMTEFSAWEDTTTLEEQKRFLIQTVDYFENDDDVERYAWFTGRRNGHPYNGLFDHRQSGILNELGSIYVNMPVHGDASVHNLPKLVEAENYTNMNGIRLEETLDSQGFLNVSNVEAGDWIEYNVVSAGGDFDLALRVASELGGTINVLVNGQQQATINVSATGGLQVWGTATGALDLPAGSHKLRLVFNASINLNWVNVSGTDGGSSSSSSSSSSISSSSSSSSSSVNTGGNQALNRPVTVSSIEGDVWSGVRVNDGDLGSRWSSQFSDNEWITIDLGTSRSILGVVLHWEAAYGRGYQIQVSNDANLWTTVHTETNGSGGIDDIPFSATGRYVRMLGTERATGYGYSLWEFEIY